MTLDLKTKAAPLLVMGILFASCLGCSKDAGDESAAIKNLPSNPAATPNGAGGGGSVGGAPAVFVPKQKRPDGK